MSVEHFFENDDVDIDDLVREVIANRYDHTAEIPETPDYLIYIDGKGLVLPGASIVGVYGPPKSRKSSFMAMLAASSISEDGRFENIESKIEGSVVWFDTEQSDTEVQYFQNNVIAMSGLTDDELIRKRYHVFKIRPYDEEQRLQIVDRMLTAPNIIKNIGLIVLDGLADLIYNVNEIEASKKLVTRLTQWADYLDVPLIIALHTNKDGKDATGALGGFVNKKASYTIKCEPEYENGPSQIRPYYTRNGQNFKPFFLTNDEETGRPMLFNMFEDEFVMDPIPSRSQIVAEGDERVDLEAIEQKGKQDVDTLEIMNTQQDNPFDNYTEDESDDDDVQYDISF